MQTFLLKAVCRTPADVLPKLLTHSLAFRFSQNTSPYPTRPQPQHPSYLGSRFAHAPHSASEGADMATTQMHHDASDSEAEARQGYRDDMAEAFGPAYATRSAEEGYGERYGEAVQALRRRKGERKDKDTHEMQRGATAERDAAVDATVSPAEGHEKSQGSEVTEKQKGRHGTQDTAFVSKDRPLPGGVGGSAT